ncbi:hypothetical protein AALP_AA6G069500, partial [Arabis alpina]
MNFLLRVSGLMTNAPYMLNVDCDMYANEANVIRQAMCIFLQESTNQNHCAFVQFSQAFNDSNTDELNIFKSFMERGVAGIQGPIYAGSGCFHTRRVMYGLSPGDLEDDGSFSLAATTKIPTEIGLSFLLHGKSKLNPCALVLSIACLLHTPKLSLISQGTFFRIGSAISLLRGYFSVEPEGVRKRSAYRWKGLGLTIPDQVSDHYSEAKEESCQRLRSETTIRL